MTFRFAIDINLLLISNIKRLKKFSRNQICALAASGKTKFFSINAECEEVLSLTKETYFSDLRKCIIILFRALRFFSFFKLMTIKKCISILFY